MTVLFAQQGRILLQRWASQKSSIASGRVVQLLRVANVHVSSTAPAPSPTPSNDSILSPTRRSFATRPGRPKSHTGRTSASKKPAASKTSTSTTAKKTAKPETKAKPKPKTKPKPKKKKAAAKSAPKKRVSRLVSEADKLRLERKKQVAKTKELKRIALSPPKKLPYSAWMVYLAEKAKTGAPQNATEVSKSSAEEYKNFTLEQKEHYNHIANENIASNAAAYSKWIQSFTPEEINKANSARLQLKKKGSSRTTSLKDDRIVKKTRTAYIFFTMERIASGDLKNMKVSEIGQLVGSEWRGLTESEKKKFEDAAASDRHRYETEYKIVYGKDAPPPATERVKKS